MEYEPNWTRVVSVHRDDAAYHTWMFDHPIDVLNWTTENTIEVWHAGLGQWIEATLDDQLTPTSFKASQPIPTAGAPWRISGLPVYVVGLDHPILWPQSGVTV